MKYVSPSWLPGGNLQTIWPALFSRRHFGPAPLYRRERWTAPDADFIDVDWLDSLPESESDRSVERPLLVLFHGLEGSSSSHYAIAFADFARHNRLNYAVPHFRGCSGQINLAPRAYHSGDYEEIGWVLERLRKTHNGPMIVVGISLGGNALLRWVQEMGADASRYVSAVAAVSAPVDLAAGGHAIGTGFNRMVYTRMFLRTMKPKALRKLDQHPGLFNREALMQARDLYDFDNVFTAPLHGFRNTQDYWNRASSKPRLRQIQIPTLVVNSRNDPFVPSGSLPTRTEVGPKVTLWQPAHGGHVGFAQGRLPGHVRSMPDAVGHWLLEHTEFAQRIQQELQHG